MINNQEGYQYNGTPSQLTLSPLYLRRTEGIPQKWVVLKAQKVGIIGVYIVFAHPLLSLVDMNGASR